MDHSTCLWPEGKKRRALAIHEQELADEDLAAARVVVDAEGKGTGGVVDTAVSLEMHLADYYSEISSSDLVRPWSNGGMEMLNRNRTQRLA